MDSEHHGKTPATPTGNSNSSGTNASAPAQTAPMPDSGQSASKIAIARAKELDRFNV